MDLHNEHLLYCSSSGPLAKAVGYWLFSDDAQDVHPWETGHLCCFYEDYEVTAHPHLDEQSLPSIVKAMKEAGMARSDHPWESTSWCQSRAAGLIGSPQVMRLRGEAIWYMCVHFAPIYVIWLVVYVCSFLSRWNLPIHSTIDATVYSLLPAWYRYAKSSLYQSNLV